MTCRAFHGWGARTLTSIRTRSKGGGLLGTKNPGMFFRPGDKLHTHPHAHTHTHTHVKAALLMTGFLLKQIGGAWKFPKTKTVLAAAGFHTIKHYVQLRRAHILRWVEDRLILKLCRSAKRRRRITPHLYW